MTIIIKWYRVSFVKHSTRTDSEPDNLARECRRRGLAVTVQRRVVHDEVAGRRDHPTADQVYEAVKRKLPGLSRTTVYRVLEMLVDAGFVRRVPSADSVVRFEPVSERHHHLVCESCGRLEDLEDRAVPPLRIPTKRSSGFEVRTYSVNFLGFCSICRRSSSRTAGSGAR